MKLPDPMAEDELDQKLRELIDDWIADLAHQYDSATPRLQKTMEENATSDEEWETLLNQIHQIYNDYTTNKIIEELEQPLTGAIPRTDKYAQGWNDCRQDIRGRFKQRINKLKALNHRKEK